MVTRRSAAIALTRVIYLLYRTLPVQFNYYYLCIPLPSHLQLFAPHKRAIKRDLSLEFRKQQQERTQRISKRGYYKSFRNALSLLLFFCKQHGAVCIHTRIVKVIQGCRRSMDTFPSSSSSSSAHSVISSASLNLCGQQQQQERREASTQRQRRASSSIKKTSSILSSSSTMHSSSILPRIFRTSFSSSPSTATTASWILLLLSVLTLSTQVTAQSTSENASLALHEPPEGRVMFGAWVQTE